MKKITFVKVFIAMFLLVGLSMYGYSIGHGEEILGYGGGHGEGTISGMKFDDVNGNGIQDEGEQGLAGWTITVYKTPDFGHGVRTMVTDANGHYEWDNVPHSNYVLCETPQEGWSQTFPNGDAYDCENGTKGYSIDMPGGPARDENTFTDVDFGNTSRPSTITVTDVKYIDGVRATAETANDKAFHMTASWRAENIGDGTGDFDLDADGFNGDPTPYQAITSPMTTGSDYQLTEHLPMTCDGDNDFALVGYKEGPTEEAALAGPLLDHETASLNNIGHDKFLLVMNKSCEVTNPSQVTVTIIKYVDGVHATAENTDSAVFPFTAEWHADNLNGGATTTGDFNLSPVGYNSPNAYEAVTAEMDAGADYRLTENIPNTCGGDNEYAFQGYKAGSSESDALGNATTSAEDDTTGGQLDIQHDRVVIVLNHKCDTAQMCVPNEPFNVTSDESTQVDGHDAVAITPHPAYTSISGATWISSEALDENGSSPTGTKVYSKTFNITDTPTDSHLEIAADNYYTVTVNGNVLDTGTSGTDLDNFSSADNWTIPAADLVTGNNTIEISVTNPEGYPDPNPSGAIFKVTVNSQVCDDNGGGGDDTPPPPPPPPSGGGNSNHGHHVGGGGGNTGGQVLGAATGPEDAPLTCGEYLQSYLRYGQNNDVEQVTKLQTFLNNIKQAGLAITGIFDQPTLAAVKNFQAGEEAQVRTPWAQAGKAITNAEWPTGYVYITTKHRINEIMCATLNAPIPAI